ncbi:unnamed protein product [Rangifer tarandus platyrhynchus]|uniref:Uncharacterized protein n=1 Tax=Rangifer tarandus platyrhynchus TaxID=3082113 RepID=A0AC59YLV1_RANTA
MQASPAFTAEQKEMNETTDQAKVTLEGAHGTADCSDESGTGSTLKHGLQDAFSSACSTQPAARAAAPTLCSRHLPFYDTKLHPPYYCHNNAFKIPLGDD